MARGKTFSAVERQYAAKAYILATTNSVVGCDQSTDNFAKSIHYHMKRLQPPTVDVGLYSERTPKNIWAMLRDSIFPDVQKFIGTLQMINDSNPTGGVSIKDVHCMAIAVHINYAKRMDYGFCENKPQAFNPTECWVNYLAFLVLKDPPKFFPETDGVYSNKFGSLTNDSPLLDMGELSDEAKLKMVESSNYCSSITTNTNHTGYLSQKKAKLEMRKRSEEKMIMQKVTDVCEVMTHSQIKIEKLIEVISNQENNRSHKDK